MVQSEGLGFRAEGLGRNEGGFTHVQLAPAPIEISPRLLELGFIDSACRNPHPNHFRSSQASCTVSVPALAQVKTR